MYLCHEADKTGFSDFLKVFIGFPWEAYFHTLRGRRGNLILVQNGAGLWFMAKKPAFTENHISILDLLRESRVPPLKQLLSTSLPKHPEMLRWISSLPQLIATFSFILMGWNGASCCKMSGMARRNSVQQCASPSSFGKKASEVGSPRLHVTQRLQAEGGSPRRWPVCKTGALTAYQATSTSTVAGNAFQAMEVGSKGKGSACVKLRIFLCYAKPWCQDAHSWAKILLHQ